MIVAQTGCPVVPAFLQGTFEVLPSGAKWPRFRRVTVRFGEPVTFPEVEQNGENKKFYQDVSQTVMARIAALGEVEPPHHRATAGARNAE
jgi:1-acyl-sn-glycerol-3-phosphate acyltransferase